MYALAMLQNSGRKMIQSSVSLTGVLLVVGILLALLESFHLVDLLLRVWWDPLVASFVDLGVTDLRGRHVCV